MARRLQPIASILFVTWKFVFLGLIPSLKVFIQSLRSSGPQVKSLDTTDNTQPKLSCQLWGGQKLTRFGQRGNETERSQEQRTSRAPPQLW